MKKLLLLVVTVVFSMGATFASPGTDTHLKGYIADSTCASSKTDMGSLEARIKCAKKCIAGGASAVLVVGDKVYKISNQKAALKYAGKNVSIDGKVTDDTIEITKITEDKA